MPTKMASFQIVLNQSYWLRSTKRATRVPFHSGPADSAPGDGRGQDGARPRGALAGRRQPPTGPAQ